MSLQPLPTVAVDAGADLHAVGFGAAVTLSATLTGDYAPTVLWEQVAGAPVVLSGADSVNLQFTTATLAEAFAWGGGELRDRVEVLGLSPEKSGRATFRVTVTDGDTVVTDDVEVESASVTSGLRNVPLGVRQHAQGADSGGWSWTLTVPGGSFALLQNATTRTPSFIPDVAGQYTLSETLADPDVSLVWKAGSWVGVWGQESSCTMCHNGGFAPDAFSPWQGSLHATVLSRGLDGELGSDYDFARVRSHSVGYDLTATNGGFDDVADTIGWAFPAEPTSGTWDDLAASDSALSRLGNVQCENCHGPQSSTAHMAGGGGLRRSAKESVCAQCHDEAPYQEKSSEWAMSGHSNLDLARLQATTESRNTTAGHCGRCHSAQGFVAYAEQLEAGFSGTIQCVTAANPTPHDCVSNNTADLAFLNGLGLTDAQVEPQTCSSCHVAHGNDHPAQLRLYDSVALLPGGYGVSGVGKGALCMACHNTRNGAHGDNAGLPTSYSAPHTAAQTDMLMGQNGYFVGAFNTSMHSAVSDTCVGCHMQAPATPTYSGHGFVVDNDLCVSCHSPLVDGYGLQAQVEEALEEVEAAIAERVISEFITPEINTVGTWYIRAWDPATGLFSTSTTTASDVALTETPNSATLVEPNGEIGLLFDLSTPVTVTWTDGSVTTTTSIGVRLGDLRNAGTGGTSLVPTSDPIVRAAWNWFLVEGDDSMGLHNPAYAFDLLEGALENL